MTPQPNPSSRIEGGEVELLRCPFCGGQAELGVTRVWCSECGASVEASGEIWSDAHLTAAWNRRALPPSFVGQDLTVSRDLGQAASGPEEATDTQRLDWLELRDVEVRNPLVYGSRHMFFAAPDDSFEGEEGPSEIRAQIDAAMKAEAASPSAPNDRTRETPKNDPREEQSDAGEGA